MPKTALGFAIGGMAAALLGGALLALALPAVAAQGSVWAVAAFASVAIPGIITGTRLAYLHGRPGPLFVVVMGAGFGVRLLLAATVTLLAAREGGGAIPATLAGLVAGFVPVAVFETVWFARRATPAPPLERRG